MKLAESRICNILIIKFSRLELWYQTWSFTWKWCGAWPGELLRLEPIPWGIKSIQLVDCYCLWIEWWCKSGNSLNLIHSPILPCNPCLLYYLEGSSCGGGCTSCWRTCTGWPRAFGGSQAGMCSKSAAVWVRNSRNIVVLSITNPFWPLTDENKNCLHLPPLPLPQLHFSTSIALLSIHFICSFSLL